MPQMTRCHHPWRYIMTLATTKSASHVNWCKGPHLFSHVRQPRSPLDCRTSFGVQFSMSHSQSNRKHGIRRMLLWSRRQHFIPPSGMFTTRWGRQCARVDSPLSGTCVHKEAQQISAVKVINREGLKPIDDKAVMNEVATLQSLANRHIVQLLDFFEEKDYFFMVMAYMTGGDVVDRIVEKNLWVGSKNNVVLARECSSPIHPIGWQGQMNVVITCWHSCCRCRRCVD